MAALAVFTCRQNSHPFQERHVPLHEAIKIGRSVARARPAPNNAIFDCKVLSRNHALLWYESGKFFLQDTKSSNGTFINNQRLSKGSEESPPHELFSGDIVQFGVDVMENSRRVTHGCIIATIQVFFPDGREASPSHSSPFLNGAAASGATLQSQELYQLAQYLQEALHREQMLENKLATLQRLVANTQEASESGWQALIDEDRLLSRLEVLENQLQAYGKNQTEETLRQELVALQEDKYNYETTAKESLRRVLQEKLDAVRKLSDLERSLSNTEDECGHLKEMCETSQSELNELAKNHQEQLKEIAELQESLKEAEEKHKDEVINTEKEKAELEAKIEEMVKQEGILSAKVESLQADNDFSTEQLSQIKVRMEALKEKKKEEGIDIPDIESIGVQADFVNLMDLKNLNNDSSQDEDDSQEALTKKLKETKAMIEDYKSQLRDSEERVKESKEEVERLQNKLEQAEADLTSHIVKIATLEERLQVSDVQMNHVVENAVADVKMQLNESRKQAENTSEFAKSLKDQIAELEKELNEYRSGSGRIITNDVTNSNSIPNHMGEVTSSTSTLTPTTPTEPNSNHLREEIDKLKELLQEARDAQRKSESDVGTLTSELESAQALVKKSTEEADELAKKLAEVQKNANDKTAHVTSLQDQLNKAEGTTKEVKQQILALRDRLLDEQEQTRNNQEEAARLKQQLQEAQQSAKQNKNEAEQLRMRVKVLQDDLEEAKPKAFEQRDGNVPVAAVVAMEQSPSTSGMQQEMQKQAAKNKGPEIIELPCVLNTVEPVFSAHSTEVNSSLDHGSSDSQPDYSNFNGATGAEFSSLKEECSSLRKRIQDIESEMKTARKENLHLRGDYTKLQEAYKDLEELKDRLENKEMTWQLNLTDAQKDSDYTKEALTKAHDEISELKEKCSQCKEEITQLKGELDNMSEEYTLMAYKSKTMSVCSMVPLLMLLFAFIMAFYPILSEFTATSNP